MKKTIFALFAVLLVLSLATCDLLEEPPDARGVVEKGMVRLAVNVVDGSTGRALTTVNAPTEADYYEVIFKTGGNYYQMAWSKTWDSPINSGKSPMITIPTANYNGNGGNEAVLFAGTSSTPHILLGVGTLSTPNIQESTTSVSFTVDALISVVNGTGSSSFKIISPSDDGESTSHSYVTGATGAAGTTVVDNTPMFQIPGAGYVAGSAPSTDSEDIIGQWTVTIPHPSYVILSGAWTVNKVTLGTWPTGTSVFGGVAGMNYTPTTPDPVNDVGSALSNTQAFEFEITLPGTGAPGVTGFYINAPVRAFDNTIVNYRATTPGGSTVSNATTSPITWNIRGGTNNAAADTNVANNTGAVIILGVGTTKWGEATFGVTTPTTYN